MRTYADTSFLVKLLASEPGSAAAVADYRSLGRPALFFVSLHELEVTNAIRQRAFHRRHAASARERAVIARERDLSLSLLQKFLARGAFIGAAADLEAALATAQSLSERHTERLGCRGFDLLHVALALELKCEAFLTSDRVQGSLAQAAGLETTVSAQG